MCGRYLTPDESDFERYWSLAAPTDYSRSYNFAPSQTGAVIRPAAGGEPEAALLVWGFQPGWSERAWINARSETAFTSKAFGPAARKRRCLVPAIGWYEWQGTTKPKQPYVFHLDGFVPFAFAGIWTPGNDRDANGHGSYAILTMKAVSPLDEIHGRMPVVLSPDRYAEWLSADTLPARAETIAGELYGSIQAYPVSTFVNKPENNDAKCIAPVRH